MTSGLAAGAGARDVLVVRSTVPVETDYLKYRPYLRRDFFFSCAYCTLTEAEASGIRFTIDHYEPQALRPDLVAAYDNLMYACGECNQRKSDLSPPASARAAGIRYFRPDMDAMSDHFALEYLSNGWNLRGVTQAGSFTIEYIDLNRQWLRRLRGIRQDLYETVKFTAYGIAGLRAIPIDLLPKSIRAKAQSAIQRKLSVLEQIEEEVDRTLAAMAASELLENDPEAEARAAERARKMIGYKALFPGEWRSPRRQKVKRTK